MTIDIPNNSPEKREALDDNARKFTTVLIDQHFIDSLRPTSFTIIVDWLETDVSKEKKLAHKTFEDGTTQILLIAKETQDGNRKTVKKPLAQERYNELVSESVLHLEKKRYEFKYDQNGKEFELKYDVFADDKLHMLEVDAASDDMRAAFAPEEFPSPLSEVTGNLNYYGYRVCSVF